jgi:hypothetical protein
MAPRRADDSALILMTVTDAAAVAVVEDRLAPETAARLANPGRRMLGLPLLRGAVVAARAAAIPEPSPDDWAAAAQNASAPSTYEPIPVGLRVGLATMAAVIFAPLAVFVGVGSGETLFGILAGLAVVAVCWLAATYQVRD